MVVEIAVSGRVVLMDYDDLEMLPWPCLMWVTTNGGSKRYVVVEARGTKRYLHRLLMGLPTVPHGRPTRDRLQVDHRDGNGLNNRRSNLRVGTKAQNQQNLLPHRPYRNAVPIQSRHRGVTWDEQRKKWRAICRLNRRNHFLGHFEDEDEAAAVCAAWRARHMPFALA